LKKRLSHREKLVFAFQKSDTLENVSREKKKKKEKEKKGEKMKTTAML
jgi:hypothetical protein